MASLRDVPRNRLFATQINWCVDTSVIPAFGDRFDPLGEFHRDDLALAAHRLAGSPDAAIIGLPFRDIGRRHRHKHREICWAYDHKLVYGAQPNRYGPYESMTRDQFFVVLHRMSGWPSYKAPKRSPFRDIGPRTWAYREMCWANSVGLTNRTGGRMDPKTRVDRAMAAFFFHTFDTKVH